jgi:phenylpropionate dioxygenase-like ring-hydroxylating dioxygenase large terminal subunit
MAMTHEDNVLLTRVEGQAPMGEMLRDCHWFPAVLSTQLVANGAPRRVQLAGGNYVAFRAANQAVGIFDELCPHRGASLALARNEDNALRCLYHGWKFSVAGEVVEVPTEPRDPRSQKQFCQSVPLRHYPVREIAGIVWVWLGAGTPAEFPDFEFNHVPDDQIYVVTQNLSYNWVQNIEATVDSAHVGVLHQSWVRNFEAGVSYLAEFQAPVYEMESMPGGFRFAAIRGGGDSPKSFRITQFVLPWYSFIAPEDPPHGDRTVTFTVPVNDTEAVQWMLRYNPFRPLTDSYVNPAPDRANWPPNITAGADASWGQDREAMANGHFTGFSHVIMEDFAIGISQGKINDRTKEFLSAGDVGVVRMRKLLLDAARNHQQGRSAGGPPPYRKIRTTGGVLEAQTNWREHLLDLQH